MRKGMSLITTALVVLGLAAGPAGAVQVGDEPGPPSDPGGALEDLVDGMDGVRSGAGSVSFAGARGTAWTTVRGVQVVGGNPDEPDLDLRLLDTLVATTTDHQRLGTPKNFARGEASLGSFFMRDVLHKDGRPVLVPSDRLHGESYEGTNSQRYCVDPSPETCAAEESVQFPTSATELRVGDIQWEDTNQDVRAVVGLIGAAAGEANNSTGGNLNENADGDVVVPLPSGTQEVVAGAGAVIDGMVQPASIDTTMVPAGGSASVQSAVKRLEMLAGLAAITNAGPGRQATFAGIDGAGAETALFKIEEMTVINTDALLRLLGIDSSQLPSETLAGLADALGVHTGRFVGAVAGARNWDSVRELNAGIRDLKAAARSLTAGGACDLIDEALKATAEKAGITPPNCLDLLGTVGRFAAVVDQLQRDFLGMLATTVGEESVIAVTNVNASVGTFAQVRPDGSTVLSAETGGGIETIFAAGSTTTLDLESNAGAWNANEENLNAALSDFLGVLGPEFENVLRIRLVPSLSEKPQTVAGTYARATSHLELMKVYVDLPGPAAVAEAVKRLLAAAEEAPGTVSTPVDGALPGGGGGLGGVLPRAAVNDPMTITIGDLTAQSEHMHPGVVLKCDEADGVCDSSNHGSRPWSPGEGFNASPGGPSQGDLPRTGGSWGSTPVFLAGALGAFAMGIRRWLARSFETTVTSGGMDR